MKEQRIFERLAHALLIIAIAGNLLAAPGQAVSAKPLAAPFSDCAAQSEVPAAECEALVVLYTNMGGTNWKNHTGWLQTDTPCGWYGITCDGGTHVTGLSLMENNLSGVIPPPTGKLDPAHDAGVV